MSGELPGTWMQMARRGVQRSIRAKCSTGRISVLITVDTLGVDEGGLAEGQLEEEVARITSEVMVVIARSPVLPVALSEQDVL